MDNQDYKNIQISPNQFEFVQFGERISDKKMSDKPVGYFKDALRRFRKNKSSVVAFFIILIIALFAISAPILNRNYDVNFMDSYYSKKPARLTFFREHNFGFMDGGTKRTFAEKGLFLAVGIGVGAEYWNNPKATIADGLASPYQPMIKISDPYEKEDFTKQIKKYWDGRIDNYLEFGFQIRSIEQSELAEIQKWEAETGKHILYPLIEDNEFCYDETQTQYANYWYKVQKNQPVKVDAEGNVKKLTYSENLVLQDNYKRDANGNVVLYEYTGGGSFETAQYKIRVLYYNWYQYKNGFEPNYAMGTDIQGYDMALRVAYGVRLSLLIAVAVSIITFIIGAIYGAIEGYYGGAVDLIMERISDILSGVPFIIVATLFSIHLSAKVGPVGVLLFAYISTGWIGNAALVRAQFYRFKNQEYVMAARTLGASDWRIMTKHIFPNSLGTIVTSCALDIPYTILSESSLAYLGILKLTGPTSTSLGTMLSDAQGVWTSYPHLMLYPALMISLLMISFNLFGNGLRDALNPSLRGSEE